MPKAKLYTHPDHRPGQPCRKVKWSVGRKRNMVRVQYDDGGTYDAYPDLLKPYYEPEYTQLTCPKCGYRDGFTIRLNSDFTYASDVGIQPANGDIDWLDCESVSCGSCGHVEDSAVFGAPQ